MVDLLRDGALDATQQERIAVVQRSGEALLEVVNDVLDFSKIQSGKLELESVVYNPGNIARDTADLFTPRASGKGIKIQLEIAADLPRGVHGDPTRLRQVLGNLVSNAVKFTERGAVTLRLRMVQTGEAGADCLLIEVQDSGVGIAPEAMQRIFEPFSQADDSTTRRFGGTGLGLAISSQMVKLMGGELTVESTLGQGSVFRTQLPARVADVTEAAVAPVAAVVDSSMPLRNKRVLLADDNKVNQLLAQTILTKLGCKTRIAATGVAAVALFVEGEFDFVLMDCHMPEMDGYEATAAIRALEATAGNGRIPIVAVTANVMQGERERCIAAGMDDYLSKPFRMNDMAAVMEKWIAVKQA
jgi:CheY-like chemotaxis protein